MATKAAGTRGQERARILLGCFQPGQVSSTYSDALSLILFAYVGQEWQIHVNGVYATLER